MPRIGWRLALAASYPRRWERRAFPSGNEAQMRSVVLSQSLATTAASQDLVLHVGDGGVCGPAGGEGGRWWW